MVKRNSFCLLILLWIFAALACNIGTPGPVAPQKPILTKAHPVGEITRAAELTMPPAGTPATGETPPGMTSPEPVIRKYSVVLVPEGGTLDAHKVAESGSPLAGAIPANYVGLLSTGNIGNVGTEVWVEVQMPGGGTGWVNRKNLTETVASGEFCGDSRPLTLFTSLFAVLNTNDGHRLALIVSPIHGLTVEYIHGGPPHVYEPSQVASVFGSSAIVNWGLGPGSGMPVQGTFAELVRPDLLTVFGAGYETHCNKIKLGGASYTAVWPFLWQNINYYAVYKPGSPGTELDWMTWLAGVEYVDGQPYLFSLTRYNWEP